jgi:hypothetical protein
MDEGRKRVLGIIAGILVARHLKTTDDLFNTRDSHDPKHGYCCGSVGEAASGKVDEECRQ